MPLYDCRCPDCGAVQEIFRTYEARDHDLPVCGCGGQMARTFLPPQVIRDIEGYQSMIDGSWIGTRSQHREHLKRHGCIELGNERPLMKSAPTIPREALRSELRKTVEIMKSEGRWRER